jgi:hypothetical protein
MMGFPIHFHGREEKIFPTTMKKVVREVCLGQVGSDVTSGPALETQLLMV